MSKVAGFLLSPLAALTGAFKKPKAPKPVYAQPVATPRASSAVANALLSRRGSSENRRTGAGGAESSTGKKVNLGA